MVGVIQSDRHIGIAQRFSHFGSGKNNILHGSTTELLDPLLSQNPADSICNIALTASVRAHDPRDPIMKFKHDFIGKGFKSMDLNTF